MCAYYTARIDAPFQARTLTLLLEHQSNLHWKKTPRPYIYKKNSWTDVHRITSLRKLLSLQYHKSHDARSRLFIAFIFHVPTARGEYSFIVQLNWGMSVTMVQYDVKNFKINFFESAMCKFTIIRVSYLKLLGVAFQDSPTNFIDLMERALKRMHILRVCKKWL